LWGLDPLPYHLVNVLLHGFSSVVLWRVLRRLRVPGAWLGAALWAIHPVGVESVAWITEMKNAESGFFFLLSILFFVRWFRAKELGGPTGLNYALGLLFGALAMASKSSTVILPVVLCLRLVDRETVVLAQRGEDGPHLSNGRCCQRLIDMDTMVATGRSYRYTMGADLAGALGGGR
jgi:hypothetical protein